MWSGARYPHWRIAIGVGVGLAVTVIPVALVATADEPWQLYRSLSWIGIIGGIVLVIAGRTGRGERWAAGCVPGGIGLSLYSIATLVGDDALFLHPFAFMFLGASFALEARAIFRKKPHQA